MTASFRHALMSTGMIAVLFYVLHIVIGGFLWQGYSHLQQPISDLTSGGAPDRSLLLVFTTIYGFLALAFAVSFTILESRKHHRLVLWGGIFFIVLHIISLSYGFFPEDMPNTGPTFKGMMHLIVTVLIVPFTILTPLFTGFGFRKEPGWQWFGRFSIFTGLLICIFGSATAIFFSMHLPYFGMIERLNIGTLQLWTVVFSIKLIRTA